jgi:hypothetical protein
MKAANLARRLQKLEAVRQPFDIFGNMSIEQLREFISVTLQDMGGKEAALIELRNDPGADPDTIAHGLKLLKKWLSTEQLAQYNANEYFDVTGSDSGKRYRISHGTAMNIHEIDGAGRTRVSWCFVPKGYLVAGDIMLAQKIALETDERGALAVANRF